MGSFSRPHEHFTTGPPLLPHFESKRPSTAPNAVVARARQQHSRRSIKSSQSMRNRGKLNFLKKAQAINNRKSNARPYKPTKYNFVRDPKSWVPFKNSILIENKLLNSRNESNIQSPLDMMMSLNMPTGKTRLDAMGDYFFLEFTVQKRRVQLQTFLFGYYSCCIELVMGQ